MRRRRSDVRVEPAVERVKLASRALVTVRERDWETVELAEGALVRLIPESPNDVVERDVVPGLVRRGAAAVRVAPREPDAEAVVSTEPRGSVGGILHYHPESDCYWWASVFDPGDGLVVDVTDLPHHVEAAMQRGVVRVGHESDVRVVAREVLLELRCPSTTDEHAVMKVVEEALSEVGL